VLAKSTFTCALSRLQQGTIERRVTFRFFFLDVKTLRCSEKLSRLEGKRHICERPSHIEGRRTIGHFEVDTVVGKGSAHCVVTLVERKTG
jgi:hypothetical protein